MFKARPKIERQVLPHVEVAAPSDFIPLKENWPERWCTLPKSFEDIMSNMLHFQVRCDDVFVVAYMKCGTTWIQEAAWLLMNNLDYERARKSGILERSIFLDFAGLFKNTCVANSFEICNQMPSPRLIKTHLPANLLPTELWEQKQKTIYVARNAKDVVVSSYHYLKALGFWSGEDINEYAIDFMNNEIMYTPFWAHVVDFWKLRKESFIFFVTYEEMKHDLAGVLQRLCRFLERPELNPAQLKETVDHLSFAKMKNNKHTNLTHLLKEITPTDDQFQFMRRGIIGSYKDELSLETQHKLNTWSREFLLNHGIKEEHVFGII